MKNRTLISLLGLIVVSSTGIGGCDPEEEQVVCPRCDDGLSWDTTKMNHTAYGEMSLEYPKPDSYAREILDKCPGWSIFEDHNGGYDDTLEITSCSNGVRLIWAYNHFSSIYLSQGWTGSTVSKMAIGSSYQDFIQAYPGYGSSSMLLDDQTGNAYLHYESGLAVFKNGVLTMLTAY